MFPCLHQLLESPCAENPERLGHCHQTNFNDFRVGPEYLVTTKSPTFGLHPCHADRDVLYTRRP